MNTLDKIRIKRKIHKLCKMMKKKMDAQGIEHSINTIKYALRNLPQDKREGLLDVCMGVLKNGC